jgi:hypothetical protein
MPYLRSKIQSPMTIVNRKNASALRRYLVEYTVLSLTLAVVFLFYKYQDLNDKIINLQTNVIQENTKANIELKSELQTIKNLSR